MKLSRPIPGGTMLTRRGFGAVLTGAALGGLYPNHALADGLPWTVAIVPDPQYLAETSNESCHSYERMVQWAIDNRNLIVNGSPLNIKGFIQVGDCQNGTLALRANGQQNIAVRAWSKPTSQNMFVAWCCGNHDYENPSATDRSKIGHAWRSDTGGPWSPENLAAKYGTGIDLGGGDYALWGGVYSDATFPRSSANNYIRLSVGGRKILILALEFYPRSAVLNWAKALHDQYADHEVWLTTHGYMDVYGKQDQRPWVNNYKLADAPSSNSGTQMWAGSDASWSGLKDWSRLRLVTCGHWTDGYTTGWVWQRREDIGTARQTAQQIFCNAQVADLRNPCTSTPADAASDIAHLMLLRIWPSSCEAFMVSTNTGLWTGARPVRNSPTPVQLFSVAFPPVSSVPSTAAGTVAITAVSNSSTGQPNTNSGSWVSIYGRNLSAVTREWSSSDFRGMNLPMNLAGVSVKINGKAAAVYYVSAGQLNVQVPTDTAVGQVNVEVTNSFGTASGTVTLQTYAPGFFTFAGQYVAAVHADGVYVAPAGYFGTTSPSRPAKPGETLMIFGTGFGPTTPSVPAGQVIRAPAALADPSQLFVTIGGMPAQVQWAGLVAVGEYQLNIVVPGVPDGNQPVAAYIGGVQTNSVSIAVQS